MREGLQTILVVDDTPENIDLLIEILGPNYRVKIAGNGQRALKIAASKNPPDIILLDVMMPEMDGYEVCQRLKENIRTSSIPVIFITTMSATDDERKGLDLGAVDYITKPFSPAIVEARVKNHLFLHDQKRDLEKEVRKRTAELNETRLEIIRRLSRAAEFKDNDTGLHLIRMSHYAYLIAEAMGLPPDKTELIFNASPMHDIGKIGVPDEILCKPGALNEEEWKQMKRHSAIGAEIIGEHSTELLALARTIALTHHEHWDGTGYPEGLKGNNIPVAGRIAAVADVFDALTNARPYKAAWLLEDAVEAIKEGTGNHFDPEAVKAFLDVMPKIVEIHEQYHESDGECK